jgi:hypothetical protein
MLTSYYIGTIIVSVIDKGELIMNITTWNIESETGYKPMTTFYEDFSIADKFGISAITDTYNSIKRNLKSLDYKYTTELYMALNWKIWEHYYKNNEPIARLYDKLWREIGAWVYENFNKEELSYFYRITD